MGDVTNLAERFWTEAISTVDHHPFTELAGLEEMQDGLAFVSSFANVTALDSGDGLLLIDTGSFFLAHQIHDQIRGWREDRIATAVYTHGHVDHVFGLAPFEAEAEGKGWDKPHVIAHDAVPARFDRYQLTNGYNGLINQRQFQTDAPMWPKDYRYPDETIAAAKTITVGDDTIELFHDRGETDDHVWAWLPQRSALCTGDLFIWASPNCGNPQKVQRYPKEWAAALRKMEALGAASLFPGHGPPILGAARVKRALSETAELLETLLEQTLAMMNEGATLNDVIHGVKAPEALLERPYLRPVYDEPTFIVRNIWRLYGGWYDGNPANLKPAPEVALASEIAALSGGAEALVERAAALSSDGEHALACHLAELAGAAASGDSTIASARGEIYRARAEAEQSLMAKGIYDSAAKRDA